MTVFYVELAQEQYLNQKPSLPKKTVTFENDALSKKVGNCANKKAHREALALGDEKW